MRLRLIAKPFDDPDYIFELKHDGFRALAYIDAGECKLVSRNLNHFKPFESLKKSLNKLPVQNAILDGEIVCLDSHGVSQFHELFSRRGKPAFYAFDLLWLDSQDFRGLPLIGRKQSLRELIQKSRCERLIYAQHIETQGISFFEEMCARDLEGVVAKRKLSIYKSNGTGWLKVKNPKYSQAVGRHDLFKRRDMYAKKCASISPG
jgi:bifunctional non-homologous end joining protein LigD